MLKLKPRFSALTRVSELRLASQWVKASNSAAPEDVNVEKLFVETDVQKLLMDLTEIDLENKVFRPRRTSIQQRSHFALMTDERLEKTRERMREEARRFLQFVPVKEPRQESVQVLSKDVELQDFDTSKFVFTDITFDATDQDRTVVVREPDGTLRTANPEEHDRMNRTFYQKPNRPVNPPPLFTDPYLQDALDKNEHEFVLDWACWFYEPDDPSYIRLSQLVFDRINESNKFRVITSTRHFGPFAFYLALNDNIPRLLNYFGGLGRLADSANLIRLQKTVRPDWRVTIAQGDSDEKIVKDFLKQNNRFREKLADLIAFINTGKLKTERETEQPVGVREKVVPRVDKRRARITSANIRGADGPLGELSEEYSVKVVKSEGSGAEGAERKEEGRGRGRWRSREQKQEQKDEEDGQEKEVAMTKNTFNRKNAKNAKNVNVAAQKVIDNLLPLEKKEAPKVEKLYQIGNQVDLDWQPSFSAVVKMLLSIRIASALWGIINDCDEVYNYWEPLHMFLYKEGFQTWEYSPIYAIRSYLYIYIHYVPASVFAYLFEDAKIVVFTMVRLFIGVFCLFGEYYAYEAICKKINVSTGRFFIMFTMFSPGMFMASTAFLPSSFAMTFGFYMLGAILNENWPFGIFCVAFSTLVGWPFVALLSLPLILQMLLINRKFLSFFGWSVFIGICIIVVQMLVDSYYFGKTVVAPYNIFAYNILSGPGSQLYGTAPRSYYIKNMFLNWNVASILCWFSLPLSAKHFARSVTSPTGQFSWTGLIRGCMTSPKSYKLGPIAFYAATASIWFVGFLCESHKEERFMFPIYPHVAFLAAIACDAFDRLYLRGPKDEGREAKYITLVLIVFILFGGSRVYSNYKNYGAHVDIYKSLHDELAAHESFDRFHNPIRVCVGKEWHRFPSSFFIPHSVKDAKFNERRVEYSFLQSEFRGILPKPFRKAHSVVDITRHIPSEMNDLNQEEPSRYVDLDSCDYVIDADLGGGTEREPSYNAMPDKLMSVVSMKFIDAEKSRHFVCRAFYLPIFCEYVNAWTTYTVYRKVIN
ncbi:unnamed protein product [Caenorhabditis sp. 36 PRJEB53466]|nr:unnamed protein product [Caenorhabditis sp. 36 PRJEB53466]